MKAFKFLRRGGRAPVSGLAWPATDNGPGPWMESEGPVAPSRSGLHACRVESLAYWLHDELWELELEGEVVEVDDLVVARRARLVRHVEPWVGGFAQRFVAACRARAAEQSALASDAGKERARMWIAAADYHVAHGNTALGAYTAAMGVARLDAEAPDVVRFREERRWQSDWIATGLGLSA